MLLAAQPKSALALLQKTLSDASALPPDDPLRIRLEMEHASAVSALGDRKAARKALEALYDRSPQARGERDPATLDGENNLAILTGPTGGEKPRPEHIDNPVPSANAVHGARQ